MPLSIIFLLSLLITLVLLFLPEKQIISNSKELGISVIIPAYNSGRTIEKCLNSILATKYKNLEIIVVNDGSIDDTVEKIKPFKKLGVKLINQENQGKFAALNNGFRVAKNPIIFALDADTFVAENCFSEIIKFFGKKVGAVIPKKMAENNENKLSFLQHLNFLITSGYLKIQNKLNKFYFLGCPAIAVSREAWLSNKGFRKKVADDADFILRLGENGWIVKYAHSTYVKTVVPDNLSKLFSQHLRWGKGQLEMLFTHWKFLIKNIYWLLLIQPQIVLGLITLILYGFSFIFIRKEILSLLFIFFSTLIKNYKIVFSFMGEYLYLGLYSGLPNLLLKIIITSLILTIFFKLLLKSEKIKISIGDILLFSLVFLPIVGMITLLSYFSAAKDLMFYRRIRHDNF